MRREISQNTIDLKINPQPKTKQQQKTKSSPNINKDDNPKTKQEEIKLILFGVSENQVPNEGSSSDFLTDTEMANTELKKSRFFGEQVLLCKPIFV